MFSGVIEGLGTVRKLENADDFATLAIAKLPSWKEPLPIGCSVAVNGACLTVIEDFGDIFKAQLSFETLEKTNLKQAGEGTRVNLERSITAQQRIDGHFVSGHVDGMGRVERVSRRNRVIEAWVSPDQGDFMDLLIEKGSIAIDGVSLTVNQVLASEFQLVIIPHTEIKTLFQQYSTGTRVNIEFDAMAKYFRKWYLQGSKPASRHRMHPDF
jgi:riboflavin synthase